MVRLRSETVPLACGWAIAFGSIVPACSIAVEDEPKRCATDQDCADYGFSELTCDAESETCKLMSTMGGGGTANEPPLGPADSDAGVPLDSGLLASGGSSSDASLGGAAGMGGCSEGCGGSSQGEPPCDPTQSFCSDQISLHWEFTADRMALGESTGGNGFASFCTQPNQLLTGIRVLGRNPRIYEVSGICSEVQILPAISGATPRLVFGASIYLTPPLPGQSDHRDLNCGPGRAVVGIGIANQNAPVTDFLGISAVRLRCAEVYVDTPASLGWSNPIEVGAVEANPPDAMTRTYEDTVPETELVIGMFGKAGSWLDSVGLSPATPKLLQGP